MKDPIIEEIIEEFVGVLLSRAAQQGDGQLGYIHGYLTEFLKTLKLGTFERELMINNTAVLHKYIKEYDQIQNS